MFKTSRAWFPRAGGLAPAAVVLALAPAPANLHAQSTESTPTVYYACYVPDSGVVYRIKEPGLLEECSTKGKSEHVEFSWTDGLSSHDHGILHGLTDDDHPQYLLVDPDDRSLIAALSAGGFKITGLAAGTANGDAVRFEQAVLDGDAAAGDLSGSFPNPSVARLQGTAIATTAPVNGQVLTYDGASWTPTTPAQGVSDHGQLDGLQDDDHAQYLLVDGVRSTHNGFAVTGMLNTGTIPVEGSGVRMMWYPAKAAFRAGYAGEFQGGKYGWNDSEIGRYSVAMGVNTVASGTASMALGASAHAVGDNSTVLGSGYASGTSSTAIGPLTQATGDYSMAVGSSASTNGKRGAFVYGDNSSSSTVEATEANQFVVRASGGTVFYSNATLSSGVELAAGGGAWNSLSDVNRKENFHEVDGESVLEKISRMPIREWNYTSQNASIRHLGPTAQDFRAAFGLGDKETAISTVDADGVSLLAAQALERRTREMDNRLGALEALGEEHARLMVAHEELRADHEALVQRLSRIEAVLEQLLGSER